jgi:hypothetical protein
MSITEPTSPGRGLTRREVVAAALGGAGLGLAALARGGPVRAATAAAAPACILTPEQTEGP